MNQDYDYSLISESRITLYDEMRTPWSCFLNHREILLWWVDIYFCWWTWFVWNRFICYIITHNFKALDLGSDEITSRCIICFVIIVVHDSLCGKQLFFFIFLFVLLFFMFFFFQKKMEQKVSVLNPATISRRSIFGNVTDSHRTQVHLLVHCRMAKNRCYDNKCLHRLYTHGYQICCKQI